jgi:4-amino-4-deoxy-L-arabinose transferase-like glycosyltransferase
MHEGGIVTKKNTIILGGIIIFALALRYTYFVGFNLSDDQFYIDIAHNLMHGNLGDHGVFANRVGMTYPLALTYILFGVEDYTTTLYPMICAIGYVVLAYLRGSLFYTPTIGLIAAFLFSFYPLHILYSSVFMPDIPIEFFGSAAIILFFCVYKRNSISRGYMYRGF